MDHRISIPMAAVLIAVAAAADGVQFIISFLHVIPLVGNAFAIVLTYIVTFFAETLFFVWFLLLGVNYLDSKDGAKISFALLGSLVAELVPIINAIPTITAGVISVILIVRMRDRGVGPANLKKNLRLARFAGMKTRRYQHPSEEA